MFRVILWKEWREQAAIIAALLILGGATMAAAMQLGSNVPLDSGRLFSPTEQVALVAFALLGLTAGTVLGASLFAGEIEAGTDGFLRQLPVTRWQLWRAKVLAGFLLTVSTTAALVAIGVGLGAAGTGGYVPVVAGWIAVLTFAAFAWGTVGSVRARGTLAACGLGLLFSGLGFLGSIVAAAIMARIFDAINASGIVTLSEPKERASLLGIALFLGLPLLLSALLYAGPDWLRSISAPDPALRRGRSSAPRTYGWSGFGFRGLVWLLFRQTWYPTLILSGVALLIGGIVASNAGPAIVAYPAATLFLGVIVGAIGWTDEKWLGAARFWGEQRLPIRRLWLAKVVVGAALTLATALLVLLPILARQGFDGHYVPVYLYDHRWQSFMLFMLELLTWPIYGFVAGHLAGMLFPKPVVAVAVGLITAGPLAALWFPSFFGGGLSPWQVLTPPAIGLLTAKGLVRAWSADRLGSRRPILKLATGLILILAVMAGGLAWRVLEVPLVPEADDDLLFARTVPTFEQNEAGRDIRAAAGDYGRIRPEILNAKPVTPVFPKPDGISRYDSWLDDRRVPGSFQAEIKRLPSNGYPEGRPDLDSWLDEVFNTDWAKPLFDASGKPVGVIEDVTAHDISTIDNPKTNVAWPAGEMAYLLLARGLQLQASGNPAPFVKHLDAALAIVRNMRNKSPDWFVLRTIPLEQAALLAFIRWQVRLSDRPDLMREAFDALSRHEATAPRDPIDAFLAEQTIIRNSVRSPTGWATRWIVGTAPDTGDPGRQREFRAAQKELEINLLAFAWAVPWERERLRRLVGIRNAFAQPSRVFEFIDGTPRVFFFGSALPRFSRDMIVEDYLPRATRLLAAIRLFQFDSGRAPIGLEELVPKYLPEVPADPFDIVNGGPFRYRVSQGETVYMEEIPVTNERFAPRPTGPGQDVRQWLEDEQFDAVATVAGSVVRLPVIPPDLVDMLPGEEQFEAAAALVGGTVQRDLPPLISEGERDEIGMPGAHVMGRHGGTVFFRNRSWSHDAFLNRRKVEVVPGQAVLWSVGPDGNEHGGKIQWDNNTSRGGDLIIVVPAPDRGD